MEIEKIKELAKEAEEQEKHKEAEIVEVTTQTDLAIRLPNGKIVNQLQLLIECYNSLKKIEKSVV